MTMIILIMEMIEIGFGGRRKRTMLMLKNGRWITSRLREAFCGRGGCRSGARGTIERGRLTWSWFFNDGGDGDGGDDYGIKWRHKMTNFVDAPWINGSPKYCAFLYRSVGEHLFKKMFMKTKKKHWFSVFPLPLSHSGRCDFRPTQNTLRASEEIDFCSFFETNWS